LKAPPPENISWCSPPPNPEKFLGTPLDLKTIADGQWRIKTNQEMTDILKGQNIIEFIKDQKLNWLWHVERIAGDERLVVSMLASGNQDRGFKPSDFSMRINPQHAFLRRGSKGDVAVLQHVKEPCDIHGSRNRRPN
jgi:hypothetical protein